MYSDYSSISFRAEVELAQQDERLDLALLAPIYRDIVRRIRESGAKPIRELREICIKGKTPAKSDYTTTGIPVIKVGTVTNTGDLDWEKSDFISETLYRDSYEAVTVEQEDIVIVATGKGSIGKVAIFTDPHLAVVAGENCILRCDRSRIDPYYLTAFLLTKYGWAQLDAYPLGPSGQTHLYPRQIDKILVPILDNASQVANKYRKSIDLQKRAQHISIEIQELFDSYIAQYYSPTVSISSLIPIASCVFEARLDPGFWSIRLKALLTALGSSQEEFSTVKDVTISSIRRGVQPEYSDSVGTIPALKTVDVQNRRVDWTACRRVTEEFFKNHPRARLHYGDIVVTSSGEGSWGRAAICDTERAVADSHLTVLKIDEDIVDPYSVLAFLWSEYGRMQFEQRVRGSTGQTEIYPRDIEKIKVLIPSISDQMLIRDKIEKQFDLIEKAEETRQQVIQEIEYCLGETQ